MRGAVGKKGLMDNQKPTLTSIMDTSEVDGRNDPYCTRLRLEPPD